jgi:ABC transporter
MTALHAVLKKLSPLGKPKSPGRAAVEIRDLSKRFGAVAAVNHLSFDIEPGRVTGFLGPNGAGKSTTLRALLGLVQPSSGAATFGGLRYDELDEPSARVGAVLEDASFHPGRSARNHLRVLAITGDHPPPARSAQSAAHTATIRRSGSLSVCGEPTPRFSQASSTSSRPPAHSAACCCAAVIRRIVGRAASVTSAIGAREERPPRSSWPCASGALPPVRRSPEDVIADR